MSDRIEPDMRPEDRLQLLMRLTGVETCNNVANVDKITEIVKKIPQNTLPNFSLETNKDKASRNREKVIQEGIGDHKGPTIKKFSLWVDSSSKTDPVSTKRKMGGCKGFGRGDRGKEKVTRRNEKGEKKEEELIHTKIMYDRSEYVKL